MEWAQIFSSHESSHAKEHLFALLLSVMSDNKLKSYYVFLAE